MPQTKIMDIRYVTYLAMIPMPWTMVGFNALSDWNSEV